MTSVAIRAANYLERRIQLANVEPLPKWTAIRAHSSRRVSPLRSDGMAGPALGEAVGASNLSDRDDQTTRSLPMDPAVPVGTSLTRNSRPDWLGTAATSNA